MFDILHCIVINRINILFISYNLKNFSKFCDVLRSRNNFLCPGWILIDRCGKHFGAILNFLRDGSVPLPESKRELLELQKEAKYYLIEELVKIIDGKMKSQVELEPICKVPLITSQKEEQALVASTSKVCLVPLFLSDYALFEFITKLA